jgi:hypothetical protein
LRGQLVGRRKWALLVSAVAAASLIVAVPASASHHPPNAVPGKVTLTVSGTPPNLDFGYTVSPPDNNCGDIQCPVNQGKPYGIELYVDGPDGTGVNLQNISIVSAPTHCVSGGGGNGNLVYCNAPGRDITNPDDALPLNGSFVVHVKGFPKGSTAEIDVLGYSGLNTYQEGLRLPADCSSEQTAVIAYGISLNRSESDLEQSLRDVAKTDNAGYGFILGGLPGFVSALLARDQALDHYEIERSVVITSRVNLAEASRALAECLSAPTLSSPVAQRALSSAGRAGVCTDPVLGNLLVRAKALNPPDLAPVGRKIVAEYKSGKHKQAARDLKQLKARLGAESKRIDALWKAFKACHQLS